MQTVIHAIKKGKPHYVGCKPILNPYILGSYILLWKYCGSVSRFGRNRLDAPVYGDFLQNFQRIFRECHCAGRADRRYSRDGLEPHPYSDSVCRQRAFCRRLRLYGRTRARSETRPTHGAVALLNAAVRAGRADHGRAPADPARSQAGSATALLARSELGRQPPKHQAITAFWACMRFSASSQMTDCGPSMTASVTSSPRCAGRQCRNKASLLAAAISASLT